MANTNSIEKVILNNKNASSHPQLASMLSEYTAAVASGYVVPTAMIVAILNLAPTNTTALANLNALKTQLHSSGFINDTPVAVNDTLVATEDTAVTYTAAQLLGNDTDVDGDTLTIAAVTSGAGGTAVLNGNGTVTFTPNANFNGAASFTYTTSDGSATSNSALVTVNVAAVNDAPVAVADTLSATEDTAVTYTAAQLLGNDTDVDNTNAQLSIFSVTSGTGGTAVLNGNGTVTFTPNANFNGVAHFTYTTSDGAAQSNSASVTVNVAAVNDAPVAVADTLSATEDTAVTYTAAQLLGNDTDVDNTNAQLSIFSVTSGAGGVAVLNADGTVTFTPGANFNGAASFSYTASDGSATSNSASVTVNVAAVNDAPVANPDTLTATEDTAATYTAAQLLGNDTDVDNTNAQLSIASVASGTGGTAVLNLDGTVTFTPGANFNGAADFSYTASDGQATSAPATVTVNVAAVNDAPVNTVPGAQTVNQNTNLSITGLSVSDVDAGSASITTTLSVAHGTLTVASMGGATVAGSGTGSVTLTGSQTAIDTTLAASNNVVYRGSLNFNGSDTLTVTTNDNGNTGIDPGLTDGATAEQDVDTVAINVTAVNVAAPVFDLTFLGATQGFIIQGDTASDLAGFSVASAGDVNGDGFADLIVGAPYGDDGGLYAGEAYVVFGKSTGFGTAVVLGGVSRQVIDLTSLSATDGFIIQGDTAGDQAGRSVASAGDVNGDGFADLIMGAPFGDDGGNAAGEAYVLFGKSAGFGTTVNTAGFNRQVIDLTSLSASGGFIIQGDTAGDQAGFSVASAGDVNGDGFADLIVGAPYGDDGGNAAGEAYVVFGKSTGFGTAVVLGGVSRQVIDLTSLSATQGFIIQGDTALDQAGGRYSGVASAGDVNGDGFADLIVGANRGDDGGIDAGEAYVVFGKAAGFGTTVSTAGFNRQVIDLTSLSASDGFIIQGDTTGDQAGFSVASAGDVNGDGFADLIVGAPGLGVAGVNQLVTGEAYVVFGKSAGFGTVDGTGRAVIDLTSLSATEGFIIQGDSDRDQAGISVASAGDVNGDGFADLIVGARFGDDGGNGAGEAYVLFGAAFGASGTPVTTTGTAAAEIFIGGVGNDTLTGGGGADVFHAGAGHDVIAVADTSFKLADGGTGTDVLRLMGSGLTLDLTLLANNKISGIERIDLTGTGNNSLKLNLSDVLDLSDSTNQVFVNGNAGDAVTIVGTAWSNAGAETHDGIVYTLYVNGIANLLVQQDITVF